ncbi:hypothetical protein HDU76_000777, partial [Blyttiomyces sp. JEL0837]
FHGTRARSNSPDRTTLTACALVCKLWFLSAREAIYDDPLDKELDADFPVSLQRFQSCLRYSQEIRDHGQTGSLKASTENNHHDLPWILTTSPAGLLVRRLDFVNLDMDMEALGSDETTIFGSIGSYCPNVRMMRFGGDINRRLPDVNDIHQVFQACDRVRDLELTYLYDEDTDDYDQDQEELDDDQDGIGGENQVFRMLATTTITAETSFPAFAKFAQLERVSWMVEKSTRTTRALATALAHYSHNLAQLFVGEAQDDLATRLLSNLSENLSQLRILSHTGSGVTTSPITNTHADSIQRWLDFHETQNHVITTSSSHASKMNLPNLPAPPLGTVDAALFKVSQNVHNLKELYLWGTARIPTTTIIQFIINCPGLEHIRLDFLEGASSSTLFQQGTSNAESESIPEAGDLILMALLICCPRLRTLSIPGTPIRNSKSITDIIRRRRNTLQHLDISRCLDSTAGTDAVLIAVAETQGGLDLGNGIAKQNNTDNRSDGGGGKLRQLLMDGCARPSEFAVLTVMQSARNLRMLVLPSYWVEGVDVEVVTTVKNRFKTSRSP